MELRDFVAETLTQIIEGVKLAQQRDDGTNINAAMANATYGGALINVHDYGLATRVDFDLSVTAETKGGAGAKLSVFGIGAEGGAAHTAGSANRVSFSVPVRLPDGDKERQQQIAAKTAAKYNRPQREGGWQGV